ncbi:F0F1 ATP synthase subunit gamma [Campylobacter sp. Cr9]|uniref:ATP synthase F1 subunit gamma n=1 Tax=unclassified Campylobacter TaxID=2593542 RepID=UPI001EFA49CA|nr:ATP synthase F1 subunit gamma [Campylobacter sp. RM5004]MBZ7985390.1 F0F1 ATP synthase subunit gamma [Campylobacter sp. Cr9]ULO01038.1 ATP synthase, F1 complex, gamma subunit [Campylobacter sp. RM5004]
MANLKEIKRKIKSVHNTQKTTNAMKLVSTAKLKKAEELAKKSKVYANKLQEVMHEISYKLNQFDMARDSRFFGKHEIKVVDVIFITSDKGLCGGFNIKTLKEVSKIIKENKEKGIKTRLRAIGKVGIEFFNFQKIEILDKYTGVSSSPDYEKAREIINLAINDFVACETDKIVLVHNGYKNMISQELSVCNLLPVESDNFEIPNSNSLLEIEPEEKEVLEELLKRYIEYSMFYSLIDSLAAEHSARMQAMDNATNNAKARVKELNLAYNKARQESITTELIEIISGVESMKE